jgi:hypothetical protein
MISLQVLLYIGAAVAVIIGYLVVKSAVQTRLLNQQKQKIHQVQAEKAAITKELEHAKKRKHVEQNIAHLSRDDVDKRLHERGEFRDD